MIEFDQKLVQEILDYLSGRPYAEVHKIIADIFRSAQNSAKEENN